MWKKGRKLEEVEEKPSKAVKGRRKKKKSNGAVEDSQYMNTKERKENREGSIN